MEAEADVEEAAEEEGSGGRSIVRNQKSRCTGTGAQGPMVRTDHLEWEVYKVF